MLFKPKSSYLVIDAIDLTVAIAIPSLRSLRPSDGERRNLKKPNRQASDFSVCSLHSLSRNDNGGGKAACACFAGRAKGNGPV